MREPLILQSFQGGILMENLVTIFRLSGAAAGFFLVAAAATGRVALVLDGAVS